MHSKFYRLSQPPSVPKPAGTLCQRHIRSRHSAHVQCSICHDINESICNTGRSYSSISAPLRLPSFSWKLHEKRTRCVWWATRQVQLFRPVFMLSLRLGSLVIGIRVEIVLALQRAPLRQVPSTLHTHKQSKVHKRTKT